MPPKNKKKIKLDSKQQTFGLLGQDKHARPDVADHDATDQTSESEMTTDVSKSNTLSDNETTGGVYPQFVGELLSQSVLDELQGKPTSGFGAKRNTGFGQSSEQRSFGSNRESGFGSKRDGGGFGDNRETGFGAKREGGGFGAKQDGGFGGNRGSFGDKKEGGGFGGNREGGGFGGNREGGGFGGKREGGGFGGNRDGGGFGGNKSSFGDKKEGGGFGGNREGGFGGNRDRGGFGGQREERSFGGSTEKSGFGERKEGGGFGDKKGGFGGNREDRNFGGNREGGGFGKREGGFGNKGSEESQERSNFRGPRAPSGDSSGFTKQAVTIGSTKGVMVTYVRDPGHFQVVLEDMSDSLDLVMDQLHEHYDKLPPNGEQLVEPRLGQGCVAQYSEDKGWYRAVVSGLLSNGLSEVMFVDYGNNECTPRETLKIIQDKFMALPAQAILCSLAGVSPSQGFWAPEHTVQFEEMVVEQSFTATFKSQSREPGQEVVYKVELVDKKNVNINQKFGTSTGTTCVESGPGSSNRTVSSGNSGMNVTVSNSDGWDEGGDTAKQGFGQGRKFGGERGGDGFRGGQGGERGFSSRERSDRSSGFGGDRNERGFGERKGGFGGDRQSDNRDRGREGGFQQRQDREGGGFGGRGGFNKEGGGRGFGQSGDRDGGSKSGGFGQRSREDGGGDQGGFGGKRGFSQGDGFSKGGSGDAGFGGNKGGFGGNKGGFGENKGGFGGNRDGFGGNKGFGGGGGGGNAAAEDDWGDDATPVPVALPVKQEPQQTQSSSQPASTVKRFRGLNMIDEDVSGDVFVNLNLNIRESVDVYVVYTVNPELFYCQVIKNSASLSEMMAQMNSFYEALSEGEMSIAKPEIGMPCAAKFSEDDTWYRAEIQTPGQQEVEVQFVDYGNTETISLSKIRKLKPEYMKMKSQGVKCGLDGVVAQNKVWEDKAVEDFEDLTMDKHLVAKIINRSSDGTHLLELENIEEKINVGDSMCDRGHCTYVSSKISPKKDQIIESPYPVLELSVGSEIDVYVSWIENPEIFWIQPVSDEEKLVGFVDCIQELYTSGAGANMNVTSVMPGQAVVALFSEDSAWYRGYVEKKGGKDIKVRFVDYGNSDMVAKESMRQPTEAMFKEASHAALCKLQGVRPLQTGVWTPDAKDIMNSLVSDVVKCKIIEVSGKQYTVQLTAGETDVTKELIQAAVVRAEKEPSPPKTNDADALKVERPKTLYFQSQIKVNAGSTEPVYVTQTDSVASFWCQLVKYYSQLDEVMGKLETSCQSSASPVDFTVNMACGAKFSGDQSWYRAKITAVYPDSVEVLFVDYGNSEKVPKSETHHLTEDLVDLPAQAIHCTLENSALSTNQLTKKFIELTSDVEISMTTVEEQEDITVVQLALASGENVAEQLGLVELKQSVDTNERKEQIRTDPSTVGTVVRNQKYPVAEKPTPSVQVYVSQIVSPADFYVQLVSQEADLNELMEAIAATYEDESKLKVTSVTIGQPCCSKFSDDGAWYRAQVINVTGSDITVRFVDYGNQETTNISNVREITNEIIRKSPFAFSCRLADIGPSGSADWSVEAIEQFEQLILDQELTCQFLTEKEVKLTLNGADIGEKLIEKGAAKHLKFEMKAEKAEDTVKISYINYKIPAPTLPTNSTTCFVSHVRTNGILYLQLACEEEKLNAITESVQDKAPSLPTLQLSDLKEGYFCIAKFSEDKAWYRAVAEVVTDSSVTVRFLDYGNSDKVETSENLKCPTEELSKDHSYAYQCQLYGVASLEAVDADKLMEVTLDKELTCIFRSNEVPYKVELHDDEEQSIAQLVMKEAVSEDMVVSSTEVEETQFETGEAVSEDMVATTSTGVEGMPSKTVNGNETSESQELEPEPADLGVDLDNFVSSIDELNTETLGKEERVRVLVAQAESPSEFWVQLAQKKQQLDELLDQMFDLYSTLTDNRVNVDSINENSVVAAQFLEDESWYRAKVLKVEEDGIQVQFLDHGNKELVPLSSLRKLPSNFSKLPCQGIQCSLAGVVPKEGGEWSAETTETFSEIVLEKELLLDVCGILGENTYQVQLLDMGIPVSEILVQRGVGVELATPIPVSTKTKQVFSPETKEDIIARLFEPKATEKLTKYGYKMMDFRTLEPTIERSAVIRVINTPTDFWCQMSDSSYDYLQEKLLESYSDSSDKLLDVEVGSRCVVKLKENDFFRGSVLKLDSDEDKLEVLCVDSGYIHEVRKADLLQYKTEFDKFPQLAFQCALDIKSMTPLDEWDKVICDKFREVVLECSEVQQLPAYAKMTIVRLQEDLVIVKLTIDRLLIAEHLVKLDMAELCQHVEKLEIKEDLEAKTSQKPSDFGSFVNVKLQADSEHDVHLVDCDNLDRLVFHTEEGVAIIEEVTAKIAEFVKDHEPSGESWSVGQGCLFKCPDDELWYRANIISSENENCQVFLVDFGSTYSVAGTALLPLPEDLTEIKAQAVICKLAEIEPVDEDWSDEARDFFSGQFDHDEEPALCMYVASYEDGIHEITLSQAADVKTANMMMAELEYALPVPGSALAMELLTEQAETSFHELSLARKDSYGSESGETSNEVDTTYLTTDDSHLEPDTSCLDTDTSQLDTDISCLENNQSGMIGDTSVDRSGLETETSYAETDRSYLETDTSQEVTDMSHLETDTSALDTDTSCLDTDTSCLDTDTSCLETTDTSVTETDTTETSCVTESDTSILQAPIMEKEKLISVVEEESLSLAKSEKQNLDGEKDSNGNIINLQTNICLHHIEESESDESNYEDADMNLGMDRSDLVSADLNGLGPDSLVSGGSDLEESRLNFSYSPTGYTTSELDTTDMTGLETTADVEGLETTTDMTELETTAESLFTIDQTGYTDFDTSHVTCHRDDTETTDECRDESQTEAVNVTEEGTCVTEVKKDNTSAVDAENETVDPDLESKEEAIKDISLGKTESKLNAMKENLAEDTLNSQTNVTGVVDVLSKNLEVGSEISENAYCIDQELNFEEEVYQSDDDTGEQVDSSFTNVTALTHPSISDTAQVSVSDEAVLVDELGDRLANTNIASRTQSISTCETCGSDVSSYLDTTGCSSDFSFYICYECQQLKEGNVPASDFHLDNDANDNNRSKKFSEVFEIAAESEEDKEHDHSGTHAVAHDIDNKLPDRGHEVIVEEVSVLARQKEEQSAFGQYSAVVLTPLDFKSETVDQGKLKQESECDDIDISGSVQIVAEETETMQIDKGETEDQYLEQKTADTLNYDVLEPNKDDERVADIEKIGIKKPFTDDGELDTDVAADQENVGRESIELSELRCLAISEGLVAEAAGSLKEFQPLEILDEVSQILSDLQDMVCGEGSADAAVSLAAYPDDQESPEIEFKTNMHDSAGFDSNEGNEIGEKIIDLADISSSDYEKTAHKPLPPEYIENITENETTVEDIGKCHQTETAQIEENLVMDKLEKLNIDRVGTDQVDLYMDEKLADDNKDEKETVDEYVDLPQPLENITENINIVDDSGDNEMIKERIAVLNTHNSLYNKEELAIAEDENKQEQVPTADPDSKEDSDRIEIDTNQIETDEIHSFEAALLLTEPKPKGDSSQSCTETAEEGEEDIKNTDGAGQDDTEEDRGDTTDVSQPREESVSVEVTEGEDMGHSGQAGQDDSMEEIGDTTDMSQSKEESVTNIMEPELDESEPKAGLEEREDTSEELTANGNVESTTEEETVNKKEDVVPGDTDETSKDVDGANNVTEEQIEPNNNTDGQIEDGSNEMKSKETVKAVPDTAQSDDSDTEAFEDADVAIEENGIMDRKREKVSSDKESADDSEAFYDVESDDDAKVKET